MEVKSHSAPFNILLHYTLLQGQFFEDLNLFK